MEDPKPNTLNPERMLQVAQEYLSHGDLGAARFYGNFALAIGSFDQQLVDAGSIIAPDPTKTKEYLTQAKAVVSSAMTPKGELETKLDEHTERFNVLKEQFGTEYSFQL